MASGWQWRRCARALRTFALAVILLFLFADANGNLRAAGGNSYTYNSWLKLVSMNGGQVALAYNGLGQLVAKTANGVTTQYLVDDLSPTGYPQVVAELVNGQAVRTYTYGLERISELQKVNSTLTASFYQYDGRGTVRMLTNSAAAVTDTYAYDAFGNLIAQTGTTPNAYLYRGERYDSDLGLYYLRARWYNPATGRFMTRDPYQGSIYDPASLHRYNYARANPVNYIDPSGRSNLMEIALNASNKFAQGVVLAALGHEMNCLYGAEASMLDVIVMGPLASREQMQILSAHMDVANCSAQITGQELLMGGLFNVGLGWAAEVPGMLLEDGAQGMGWRLLTEEEGSIGFEAHGAEATEGQINYGPLDALGRPTGVTATITEDMIGTGTPANPSITPPGWSGNGNAFNEARGHLLASQLGGSGNVAENLVTLQQDPANSPVMRGFENQVRGAVEGGQTVDYSVTPIYNGSNLAPRGITIMGTGSDDFSLWVTILNPPGR